MPSRVTCDRRTCRIGRVGFDLASTQRQPSAQQLPIHFLAKPIEERRRIADELRDKSQAAIAEKPPEIMDVNQETVEATMREHDSPFGGELAGHFYYKRNYTADSSIGTVIEVLNHLPVGVEIALLFGTDSLTVKTDPLFSVAHHHRCYRNKATSRYLLGGKNGLDFIDPLSREPRGRHRRERASWSCRGRSFDR